MDLKERIVSASDVMGGKPVIRGTRLTVEAVLGMLAAGDTFDSLCLAYPRICRDDLRACCARGGEAVRARWLAGTNYASAAAVLTWHTVAGFGFWHFGSWPGLTVFLGSQVLVLIVSAVEKAVRED